MRTKRVKRNKRHSVISKLALALLMSPYFFRELLSALRRNGLVGEERNAQVVYIVATSRVLAKPLCLFIKGPSGVGKNFLGDTVFALLPPSELHTLTSSSARSWNYLGKTLAHKLVYIKERNEAAGPVHPTRLLISETELIHWVTVRQRGRIVQKRRVTKGPIASVSTTTRDRVEVDDETRHVSIWLDESPEQTARIMEAALDAEQRLDKKQIRIWHEVQRLIERRAWIPIEFPEWFKGLVEFVKQDNLWSRRYFRAFLQGCKTVALIRSFREDQARLKAAKKITVKFTDLAITALIFNRAFTQSLDRADDEDRETQRLVGQISAEKVGDPITASDVSKKLGISMDRAYGLLRKAHQAGSIRRANPPVQANLKTYLPAEAHRFLPEPERLIRTLIGVPKKVKFVHPLTGKWVVLYRR
jgi:hypothetical protein